LTEQSKQSTPENVAHSNDAAQSGTEHESELDDDEDVLLLDDEYELDDVLLLDDEMLDDDVDELESDDECEPEHVNEQLPNPAVQPG
jgi:hypothetical protein